MRGLKEKAFKICIIWDPIGKTCLEEKYAVWLEDVEQEIDELKQKLQQLKDLVNCFIEHIPKHERDVNASYANFIWKINRKFEELLKDEKEQEEKEKEKYR